MFGLTVFETFLLIEFFVKARTVKVVQYLGRFLVLCTKNIVIKPRCLVSCTKNIVIRPNRNCSIVLGNFLLSSFDGKFS